MKVKLTGSTPTTWQLALWVFLRARETPVTVPPVPALATRTSTLPLEGCSVVDGVFTTASIISGPVVNSCANGLLTLIPCDQNLTWVKQCRNIRLDSHYDIDLG